METNNPKKILHVDDQPIYTKSVELFFRKKFNITIANSEREGLAKIANEDFDIVISDGNLTASGHDLDSDYFSGARIVDAAKAKGAYIIGMSAEPARFKKIAKDKMDVVIKKTGDIAILEYVLNNQPDKYELKKFAVQKEVSEKLGVLSNEDGSGVTLAQQDEWMTEYRKIESKFDYMK
jgi:DNA-binding NarL/FixJ family response regulator